jgi:hypothetical protein
MDKQYWQEIWTQICNMAYYRTNITDRIHIRINENLFSELKKIDYKEYTFDHVWYEISKNKNPDGLHIDALIVPELKEIYVPRVLFECAGVYAFFTYSFPNCIISYWEDDVILM